MTFASILGFWTFFADAATPSTPASWLDFLTKGGLLGGSLLIVWALLTDRLVSGTRHRQEIEARDREIELWRSAALRSSSSLERVAGVFFPDPGGSKA